MRNLYRARLRTHTKVDRCWYRNNEHTHIMWTSEYHDLRCLEWHCKGLGFSQWILEHWCRVWETIKSIFYRDPKFSREQGKTRSWNQASKLLLVNFFLNWSERAAAVVVAGIKPKNVFGWKPAALHISFLIPVCSPPPTTLRLVSRANGNSWPSGKW